MRVSRIIATVLVVAATLGVAGTLISATACRSKRGETLRTGPLFKRVQEQPGIQALATEVAKAVTADATFGPRFAKVDMARFRTQLGAFLCHAVSGPCAYDGHLSDAWRGLTLDEDEFIALMEVIVTAMNEAQLPQQEQNDLLDLMMAAHEAELAAAPPPAAEPAAQAAEPAAQAAEPAAQAAEPAAQATAPSPAPTAPAMPR